MVRAKRILPASGEPTWAIAPSYYFRLEVVRFRDEEERFFDGTFAPFLRASERPIAIACLRLFTFPPCPDFPRVRVPCFLFRIARLTLLPAAGLYFLPLDFRLERLVVAMDPPADRSD